MEEYKIIIENNERIKVDMFLTEIIVKYAKSPTYEQEEYYNVYGVKRYKLSFYTLFDPLVVIPKLLYYTDNEIRAERVKEQYKIRY